VIRRVAVAQAVLHTAHERFGEERSPHGEGSEYDFVGGPLAGLRGRPRLLGPPTTIQSEVDTPIDDRNELINVVPPHGNPGERRSAGSHLAAAGVGVEANLKGVASLADETFVKPSIRHRSRES